MNLRCLASVFFAASVTAAASAAAPPMQPTGKWVVNFADAQCLASRSYGTVEKPLVLGLKAPPLGKVMQLIVVRPGSRVGATQLNAEVSFGEGERVRASALMSPSREKKRLTYLINLPLEAFAPARTAPMITIRVRGGFDETFQLTQLEPLLKLMDECVTDLRKVWNVMDSPSELPGVAATKQVRKNPNLREGATGSVRKLFNPEDYPHVTLAEGSDGTVTLAILIDEEGGVADCSVIRTSGVAVLDAQSCAVIRERAKFKPAVGLDGTPAKDAWVQRITWRVR